MIILESMSFSSSSEPFVKKANSSMKTSQIKKSGNQNRQPLLSHSDLFLLGFIGYGGCFFGWGGLAVLVSEPPIITLHFAFFDFS